MVLFRSLLALVVVFAVAAAATAADPAKAAKKAQKAGKAVAGVVTAVELDQDGKTGTLTATVGAKKKTNTPGTEQKFKITADTKFEKGTGTAKDLKTEPGTSALVQKGSRVRIVAKDGVAEKVIVMARKNK
jgi:hypothetical protein